MTTHVIFLFLVKRRRKNIGGVGGFLESQICSRLWIITKQVFGNWLITDKYKL